MIPRVRVLKGTCLALSALALAASLVASSQPQQRAELGEVRLRLEVDLPPAWSPDGRSLRPFGLAQLNAEVALEAEGEEALRELRLLDRTGAVLLELATPPAPRLGAHEIEFGSEEASLALILREFPAGPYTVDGRTVSGRRVSASVELSHGLPGLFTVLAPRPNEVVPLSQATLSWSESAGAARYVLEVEQDELGFSLEVVLPPWITSFTVPEALLEPGVSYEYSLAVQGDTDNELEVEGSFHTAGPSMAPHR
jgi:hypothetical protein